MPQKSLLARCLLLSALPLAAQTWDFRAEVPFPKGQNLPQTALQGTSQWVNGKLDTGKGLIITVNRRILRVGPVLKFEGGLEFAQWKATGETLLGSTRSTSELKQNGLGAGINAQFWVPFTGVAGEIGLIYRHQNYRFQTLGANREENLGHTWMRVGLRWRLPFPVISPYIAASYQQPFSKERPVKVDSVQSVGELLQAQGAGQEFDRLWTFGAGLQF